jgi:hypothetical protein
MKGVLMLPSSGSAQVYGRENLIENLISSSDLKIVCGNIFLPTN